MIAALLLFGLLVIVTFASWFGFLFDGEGLQPDWRETLIRRADEQHAAIMAGDDRLGMYGSYPPAF